ncbi:prepilin-type N-terminal cleavage/methylation domain-containing protein [Chloroflexota bacterium]
MKLSGNVKSSRSKWQAGFTLLEVIISVALLTGIGIAVVRGIDTNARSTEILNEQVQATNLATNYMEIIRQLPFDSSDPPYANAGGSIDLPFQFIVDVSAHYSDDGDTWVDTYSSQKLQRVTISVSREGGKPIRSFCSYRVDFPEG